MSTPLLSSAEQAQAAAQVWELILSSGQTGILLRKQEGENLYGTDESQFTEVCSFPLELNRTPPADLAKKIDATASVLPELDIRATDRVRSVGIEYRVQTVVDESLFGVVTHKTLELVRLNVG